jgi:hypothetical protein
MTTEQELAFYRRRLIKLVLDKYREEFLDRIINSNNAFYKYFK